MPLKKSLMLQEAARELGLPIDDVKRLIAQERLERIVLPHVKGEERVSRVSVAQVKNERNGSQG